MWFRILDADRLQRRIHAKIGTSFRTQEKIKQTLRQHKNLTFPLARAKPSTQKRITVDMGYNSYSNFYAGFEDFYASGVFVETWSILPVGAPLTLVLNLEKPRQTMEVRGRVRVVKEDSGIDDELSPGLGIEFDQLTESQKATIRNFNQTREPFFYA